jgi:large subunit ribosomal protein L6
MSRVARNPITVPLGVEVSIDGVQVKVKGPKGELNLKLHSSVFLRQHEGTLRIEQFAADGNMAIAGTMRALVNNLVMGVSKGFEKKLSIIGVGYRAQVEGRKLNMTLGFSHPIIYNVPEGIILESPSQTEIVVKGIDKQLVGQTAAEIRAFRPPEPYKGKGVRYIDEYVMRKQAKKI